MKRIKLINGDEQDVFSKWRHMIRWRRGETKAIKRGYNRRFRRYAKNDLRKLDFQAE